MKTDRQFPPPPQFGQPPLRCDDITPQRSLAIHRAAEIAEAAEGMIGMSLAGELPFVGTARGFVLHAVSVSGSKFQEALAALVIADKLKEGMVDDVEGVMLIHPRAHWGVLGPMRGDVVLYSDGHCAVVTKPLCMGCQHFEAVSLGGDPPAIAEERSWLAAVKWIVRAVDESAEGNAPDAEVCHPAAEEPPRRKRKAPANPA